MKSEDAPVFDYIKWLKQVNMKPSTCLWRQNYTICCILLPNGYEASWLERIALKAVIPYAREPSP